MSELPKGPGNRLATGGVTRRGFLAATGAIVVAGVFVGGRPPTAAAADPGSSHEEEPPVDYTPYLFIRYHDDQAELATLSDGRLSSGAVPANRWSWLSPDIQLSPVDSVGNPIAGTDTTVTARIFNSGLADALPVFVEFFWCNPSLAFTDATVNHLGSALVTIPDHQHVDVVCPTPWLPTMVNNGHQCLVVRCSSPAEGVNGLIHPFDAALDRHVGQRNVTVSDPNAPLELQLLAPNQFSEEAAFTLTLSSIMVTGDLDGLRQLDPQTAMMLVANAVPEIHTPLVEAIDVTDTDFEIRVDAIRPTDESRPEQLQELGPYLDARQGDDPPAPSRVIGEFNLEPGAAVAIDLSGPATGGGNEEFLVHHFGQSVQGIPVGGYTIVVPPQGW